MRLSLRYQLLLPMLALLAGVGGLGFWAAVHSVRQAVRQQIEAQLGQVARTIGDAGFPFTPRVLTQLKDLTGAEFLLTTADGRRQATLNNPPAQVALDALPAVDWQDMRLGTAVEIDGQNYLSAKLRLKRADSGEPELLFIFYPEGRWREALWQALWPMIYLGSLYSVVAVVLAVLFAGWLARRIGALEVQTRAIAAGNFQPLPLPAWNDELRDLAASINAMAEQLSRWQQAVHKTERLRLLEQVSGGLAHQLRNGVAGARLAVQVHARTCASAEDRDILEVALRQLALVEEKIQRLLQAGRDEPLALAPCSLRQILDDAIALLSPQCQHRHIELRSDLSGSSLDVSADAGQLGHLFVNVLGNAAEAIGGNGYIDVKQGIAEVSGRKWHRVEIVDSGPGPPAEIADKLFEEFVTSKPEGIGLGLAVARQVAAAHGGRIEWSRENDCTCFRIWLPMLEGSKNTVDRIQ